MSEEEAAMPMEAQTQVVHFGYHCDGCGMDPITGVRYGKLIGTHCQLKFVDRMSHLFVYQVQVSVFG